MTVSSTPERGVAGAGSRLAIRTAVVEVEATRRELVRRIVNSRTFVRSERLAALLTYVCEMSFTGREAEINEQNIGHKVFGRTKDYDSSVDGIVRSQASRLRQRLEIYFQQEGAEEPVRIVIPRGGYVPVFEEQTVPSATPPTVEPEEQVAERISAPIPQPPPRESFFRTWWVSLVLGIMLLTLWVRDLRRQPPAPIVPIAQSHPFWSHLFSKNTPTMVVAPDSGLVLYHGLSGREIDLQQYLEGVYRSEPNGPPQIGPDAAQKAWLLDLANRRYTSMVDLDAILRLKDRATSLGSNISVRYARDLRPNDLKSGTVVLLGAASANPWVELFEDKINFALQDDFTKSYRVLNRHPESGEPTHWETVRSDPQRRVFGLIAYLQDPSGDGNALILEGTSMSGTEAAVDFVNDDAKLLPFLKRIQNADGTLPHFELLLETHNMGSSAVQSEILAWRVH